MFKKFLLLLIVALLGTLIYFSATSKMVKDFKEGKNINILFILDDVENNGNIKFFIAKYNSLNEYIRLSFIDENVTIVYKTKKARILKDMILETKPENRKEFIKSEVEKLFDNKISFDYYVNITEKDFKNVIEVFSKQENLENNLNLFDTFLRSETDRDTCLVAAIKDLNYIYDNFNRMVFIKVIKELYNKNIVIDTNFEFKDLFLLYSYFLNEDKTIKYADYPTVYKRKRIEVDENNKEKIIDFFENDTVEYKDNVRVEVLNTTNKSRLAIKAVDKLREDLFDVVDWGSSSKKYEFTTIIDFVNNYEKIKEIKDVLNCGEIIFRPQDRPLTDVSVLLGQDCTIYDKLDRESDD
ncbi:MAG: LytR C-terminal domain-containing protein [Elusimicrobia bacterium]|nr:LytR C-terminal domain-containing protein [Elusimicrobiota bacterium]